MAFSWPFNHFLMAFSWPFNVLLGRFGRVWEGLGRFGKVWEGCRPEAPSIVPVLAIPKPSQKLPKPSQTLKGLVYIAFY